MLTPKTRSLIAAHLADAATALSVASYMLGWARHDYDDDEKGHVIDKRDLMHGFNMTGYYEEHLDAGGRGKRTLPMRVFRAISIYENRHPRNVPHVEGAVIALLLAKRSLEAALGLAQQLDADKINPAYRGAFVALGDVRSLLTLLRCNVVDLNVENELRAIVTVHGAKKRRTTHRRKAA